MYIGSAAPAGPVVKGRRLPSSNREHRLLRNIEQLTKAKIIVAQVPSVADLRTKRIERTLTAIREMLAAGDVEHFRSVVTVLAKDFELVDVAAAAVKLRASGAGR